MRATVSQELKYATTIVFHHRIYEADRLFDDYIEG